VNVSLHSKLVTL